MADFHPNFEELSVFMDGESEKGSELGAHFKKCLSCQERLEKMRTTKTGIQTFFSSESQSPRASKSSSCPDSWVLSGYLSQTLDKGEMVRIDEHMFHCDACLAEIIDAQFVLKHMHSDKLSPVPKEIKEKASRLTFTSKGNGKKVAEVHFSWIDKGLKFIKTVASDLVDINISQIVSPEPAYRASGSESFYKGYELLLKQGDLNLNCTVLPGEENKITLKIRVSEKGKRLASRRLYLYSNNQVMASEKTDAEGEVEFPSLIPGDYLIKISGDDAQLKIQVLFDSST